MIILGILSTFMFFKENFSIQQYETHIFLTILLGSVLFILAILMLNVALAKGKAGPIQAII